MAMDYVSIARSRREVAVASLKVRQLELPGMDEEQVWTREEDTPVLVQFKTRTARPQPL